MKSWLNRNRHLIQFQLHNLVTLKINDNLLTRLPPGMFSTSLRSLNISGKLLIETHFSVRQRKNVSSSLSIYHINIICCSTGCSELKLLPGTALNLKLNHLNASRLPMLFSEGTKQNIFYLK